MDSGHRNITLTEHYICKGMYRDRQEYHTDGTLHIIGTVQGTDNLQCWCCTQTNFELWLWLTDKARLQILELLLSQLKMCMSHWSFLIFCSSPRSDSLFPITSGSVMISNNNLMMRFKSIPFYSTITYSPISYWRTNSGSNAWSESHNCIWT